MHPVHQSRTSQQFWLCQLFPVFTILGNTSERLKICHCFELEAEGRTDLRDFFIKDSGDRCDWSSLEVASELGDVKLYSSVGGDFSALFQDLSKKAPMSLGDEKVRLTLYFLHNDLLEILPGQSMFRTCQNVSDGRHPVFFVSVCVSAHVPELYI